MPYKGPLASVIHQLIGGLRAAMGYTGARNRRVRRARRVHPHLAGALRESHVHDVTITRESPNYPREG